MKYSILTSIITACITLTGLIFATNTAVAQNINEEVTVTAEFEPSVPDANKININPPESETDITLPRMTYENRAMQTEVTLQPESIAAVRLVGEPLSKLYRNYLKVGMGMYTTPLLDFYAGSLRSKEHNLGVHIKHVSSSGNIKNHPSPDNSLNLVELYGNKFLDQHTLSGNVGFRRNVVHHYGFDTSEFNPPAFSFNDDDLKQRFARIYGSVGIKSNYKEDDKINHFARFAFSNVSDKFETRETSFALNAGADKKFELLEITDNQSIGLTTDITYIAYTDSLLSQGNTIISLKPFIGTSFNEYSIKAGINLNFKLDTVSKAYLFPFVEGRLEMIDNALILHAGITGGLIRRGFEVLSDENPFVQSVLPLQYTREKFVFYGGVRARAGSNIDLSATFKAASVDNAAFFINDPLMVPYNRFTVVYDNGSVLAGRFEAMYHTTERIKLRAWAALEAWSLDSLEHAYHTPAMQLGVDGFYQIQNKIIARADVVVRGPQHARVLNADNTWRDEQLSGYADLSLGLEYRYTKVLSGFINFNNLLNARYYRWNGYPSYKFNLTGGVAYSF